MSSRDEEKRQKGESMLPLFGYTVCGIAIGALGVKIYHKHMKRRKNADHITPDMLVGKKWITGRVTSVGDGDGFRLYHKPLLWFGRVPKGQKALKDQTIPIRIAGVDAPERAHFGRPDQPFAVESHAWLTQRILGKTVYCQVLQRDQYSRIVANVNVRAFPFRRVNLALEMLNGGYATVYEQSSAVYGKEGIDKYLAAERKAKANRRGMWAQGKNIETPAEYKRKYAQAPFPIQEEQSRTVARPRKQMGFLVKFLRRLLTK